MPGFVTTSNIVSFLFGAGAVLLLSYLWEWFSGINPLDLSGILLRRAENRVQRLNDDKSDLEREKAPLVASLTQKESDLTTEKGKPTPDAARITTLENEIAALRSQIEPIDLDLADNASDQIKAGRGLRDARKRDAGKRSRRRRR